MNTLLAILRKATGLRPGLTRRIKDPRCFSECNVGCLIGFRQTSRTFWKSEQIVVVVSVSMCPHILPVGTVDDSNVCPFSGYHGIERIRSLFY
jgi:hypothetical protein